MLIVNKIQKLSILNVTFLSLKLTTPVIFDCIISSDFITESPVILSKYLPVSKVNLVEF